MRTQRRRRSISDFRHTPLVAALGFAFMPCAASATSISVTDYSDASLFDPPGTVSLRGAINYFNMTDGLGNQINCTHADTINFDFPNGPFIVSLASDLPAIECDGLTIDGKNVGTVPATGGIRVAITSANPGTSFPEFGLQSDFSSTVTVKNLEVFGFTYGTGTGLLGRLHSIGNSLHDNNTGFDNNGRSGVSVTGSSVTSNSTGIYVSYGGGVAPAGMADVSGNAVANNTAFGIRLTNARATVSANTITGNATAGLAIMTDQSSQITGNFIGTITGGSEPAGNGVGVLFITDLSGNPSGGTAITGNVISGNTFEGINLSHFEDVKIDGNWIGTNSGDGLGLGNGRSGVLAYCGVGLEMKDNVVSANATSGFFHGVDLRGITSGGTIVPVTTVSGNKIGVQGDGIHALGNNAYGMFLGTMTSCAVGDAIGVAVPTADVLVENNDIGFNSDVGLSLSGTARVTLHTNRVFSNGFDGIEIESGTDSNLVTNVIHDNDGLGLWLQSSNGTRVDTNTIFANLSDGIDMDSGGNNTFLTNTIRDNQGDGVWMDSSNNTLDRNTIFGQTHYGIEIISGVNNAMTGNLVYGNATAITPSTAQKNISLGFDGGPLLNDSGDVDAFNPNHGQNYPVITPVTGITHNLTLNQTIVNFTLDTLPGTYRVDLYSNAGATTVPGGDAIVATLPSFVVGAAPTAGTITLSGLTADHFSMLATSVPGSGNGETSEFSPVVAFVGAPAVSITPSAMMDFGDVAINADSSAKSVTITSSGTATYQLVQLGDSTCYGGAICATGAFTCTTTCTNNTDYAPGSSCQITATFHPPSLGAFSKTIGICDNVAPRTRTITLTGNGVVPPPILISPSSFDFGSALLGGRSASTSFTIFNPSTITVTLGPLTTSPGFVLDSTDCGTSIAATQRCHANVSFVPTRSGLITGVLSVPATGDVPAITSKRGAKVTSGPVVNAALSGTGTTQAILDLPSAIDFGDYTSGTPPIVRTVTLRNNGNAVLTLSNISVTGPFTLANGCPANLQPGESCTLSLGFSSPALAPYSGTLVVQSNATGGSRSIPLSARTVDTAAPRIRVTPISIGFGDRLLGTVSASQRVTITNEGNADATLAVPITTSLDFLVVGTTCGVSLAPAQTCFADVALRPVGFGPRSGQLLVTSNAAGSPNRVDLLGTGCRPFSSASSRLGASFGCSP